jgi:predicted O-methyltransferase YrrM
LEVGMDGDDTRRLLRDIDDYVAGLFAPPDETLEEALREAEREGLPSINVSATEGKLLQMLVGISGARKVLEIGTLGGYSAIHFARALPEEGALISLELDEHHAEVARRNVERAGLSAKVEVRVGDARQSLERLLENEEGPFDLIFIDADKEGYPEYLAWALRLSRPGTLILGDNAIREGSVIDPDDSSSHAMREFNEKLAEDPRLSAIVLPLIRERIDGLAIARVTG